MYTIYSCRAKVTAPIQDHLINHPAWGLLNTLSRKDSLKACGGLRPSSLGPWMRQCRFDMRWRIKDAAKKSEESIIPPRRAKRLPPALVEKRVRETAQVTAVTRDDTVEHCSPCSPNPDRPSGVCFNLENNEGKMGQKLEKLESSSADTGLETPGQQSLPNEETWEQRRTTANGILTAGVDSSQGGRTPSPPERSTSTKNFADIFSTAAI